MNCQVIQRRLLGSEDPAHPSAEVQAHLEACTPCREWQAALLQMEEAVRRLPTPPPSGRDVFLRRLLKPEMAASTATPVPATKRERARGRKARPVISRVPSPAAAPAYTPLVWRFTAAGLAASLLLALLAWWAVREPEAVVVTPERPQPDPLVVNLMRHDLELAKAKDEAKSAEALAKIARALVSEKRAVVRAGDEGLIDDFTGWVNRITDQFGTSIMDRTGAESAVAEAGEPPPASDVRLQQLHRNKNVINALVNCGIKLAQQADHFKRAVTCSHLAQFLAGEIRTAVDQREGDRAREIGDHFRDLLREGVAYNLSAVRRPNESAAVQEIKGIGNKVVNESDKLLETDLQQLPQDADWEATRKAIEGGREAVKAALKNASRA